MKPVHIHTSGLLQRETVVPSVSINYHHLEKNSGKV